MRKIVVLTAAYAFAVGFGLVLVPPRAGATEVKTVAGASISLGDVSGSAYYTVEQDGYRLVATLASGVDSTPVRLTTTLLSGQRVTMSVPRGVGEPEMRIEFNRVEDRLFVNDTTKLPELAN
ncbi:hypothetical protein [Microvirga massiliensis]|uniref:hypothetical protein n=1 Tax=Microvirga massiliensis TaxID=1033741 RepID=UPI00062B797B|nr:hypothetical protein [Microvirga massiliensis]